MRILALCLVFIRVHASSFTDDGSGYYKVVQPETGNQPEQRIAELTNVMSYPDCASSEDEMIDSLFGETNGERCEFTWVSADFPQRVFKRMQEQAKPDSETFKEDMTNTATRLLGKLSEKTLMAARLLVNLQQKEPVDVAARFQSFCQPRDSSAENLLMKVLEEMGPNLYVKGGDKNYLLPFLRMLRALQACTTPNKYEELESLSLQEYEEKYPGDRERHEKVEEANEAAFNLITLEMTIQHQMTVYKNVNALYHKLQKLGSQTVEAAVRIALLSALADLMSRSSQNSYKVYQGILDAEAMIGIVMEEIVDYWKTPQGGAN